MCGCGKGGENAAEEEEEAESDTRRECATRRERGTHLLAVYEDVHAAPEPVVYPAHGGLEMGAEVGGGAVEDVEAVALEPVSLRGVRLDGGEPGCVEHLDEGLDVVRGEEGGVEDGGEGAEVESAGVLLGGRGEDEVHGRAHGLHHLGRHVVEADHGGRVQEWVCASASYVFVCVRGGAERADECRKARQKAGGIYRRRAAGQIGSAA